MQVHTINPKSLALDELYGCHHPRTREWKDGALTSLMRRALSERSCDRKLLVFDGPVEPDWVENLNSVLDDNHVLNLETGEAIQLAPRTNVLLETVDLRNCSPATISRCAIVYVRDESLPTKS